MYYYIVDSVVTSNEKKKLDDIKAILANLGIAGEWAMASPARTVEEHLELAFTKGFTSIVGIGNDALINRVASSMLIHHYDQAALGAIPLERDQKFWSIIGASTTNQACQILRERLTTPIDIVELKKGKAFITQAEMHLDDPVAFQLIYNDCDLRGHCTDMSISPGGEVKIWDRSLQKTTKSVASGFFNRLMSGGVSNDQLSLTQFQSNNWEFATETPVPIIVDGETATETPVHVKIRRKALNLIVNRAKITTEKENV